MIRFALVLAALGVTAWAVARTPVADLARGGDRLRAMPAALGPWDGREYSFDDAVEDELDADDTLIRRYEHDGAHVWLCVVYHQRKRYGAHDPRLCYESQGWVLEPLPRVRVADGSPSGVEANAFLATRRKERRLVWYWWSTDGLSTPDATRFRDRMAVTGALEGRSWGAFVRVESLLARDDAGMARARLADFAARVARALPPVLAGGDPAGTGAP